MATLRETHGWDSADEQQYLDARKAEYIDGKIREEELCQALVELGYNPGTINEHLEEARNQRCIAALVWYGRYERGEVDTLCPPAPSSDG